MKQNNIEIIDMTEEAEQITEYYGRQYVQNTITYSEYYSKVKDALDIPEESYIKDVEVEITKGIINTVQSHAEQKGHEFVDWSDDLEADSYDRRKASNMMTNRIYVDQTSAEQFFISVEFDKVFGDLHIYDWEDIRELYLSSFHTGVVDVISNDV